MSTKYHQADGFKFNPAGLIGLDDSIAKGIAKHLRARERELNTIETEVITCEGGPFNGQQIEMQPNGGLAAPAKSADFTVGAWRGHYLGSKWVSTLAANAPAPEAMTAPLPRPKINCDLPAKGFDQLRDLLGEMSINPLERETTIKTRYKTARFEYGRTDDFGNEILEFSPVGTYRIEIVQLDNFKRIKNIKPCIKYKIVRAAQFQQDAMAMDDFGDLFITQPRKNEREEMTEKRRFTTYKIGRTNYTVAATIEAVERLAAKILKIKKWHSDKLQPSTRIYITYKNVTQQAAPVTIEVPTILFPKIEQPAKPLEPKNDGFGEKFTLDLNSMFMQVPYRASAPTKTRDGQKIFSTQIITRRSKIPSYLQKDYDLPKMVLAWRVSVIQQENNSFFSRIEAMHEDHGRAPGGEICAYFKEIDCDFPMWRIAPSVESAARTAWNVTDTPSDIPHKTDTPPALPPKIEQPAKPLATLANLNLHEIQQDVAAAQHRGRVYASEGRTMLSIISTRELIMASNLAAPPATTCNPDALRLRSKTTICRAANRPTWAEKLEAQADALERTDPPEPPPCKHKNKIHRQRPHKTACILLAKIRHRVRQKYGDPIRQNFRQPTNEPPAIKPVTPSAHFYQTNQTEKLTPWHALNLHPVTHQQHHSRSKQSAATYPCQPPPNFAASALQLGKTGKPDASPCPPPFGAYSTSYWITQSCSTRIKQTEATHEQKNIIL